MTPSNILTSNLYIGFIRGTKNMNNFIYLDSKAYLCDNRRKNKRCRKFHFREDIAFKAWGDQIMDFWK